MTPSENQLGSSDGCVTGPLQRNLERFWGFGGLEIALYTHGRENHDASVENM